MQGKTKHPTRLFALLAILTILLAACRAPAETDSHTADTPDINQLYTQVAGTLIAQGQQEQAPTATTGPTQTPIVVTATSSPTSEQPSNTPTNSPVPPTNTSAPPAPVCNQAAFITDVTIKDGSQMSKGESFTKTWRIKNTGTCTWTGSYTVVYSSGTNLANKSSYDLSKQVSPGETIDISIPMEAPGKNGTYTSNWMLKSGTGGTFGVGDLNGDGVPFFVIIKVGTGGTGGGSGYDFAANYCDAKWSSDTKSSLPCPGANAGTNGFVIVLQNPDLESHQENQPAIWMHPNHDNHGFIRGVFPDYTVKNGDHFTATIGCLDNNTGCRVQFTLSYIKPNGDEVQLGTWDEKFDGLVTGIDINLSSLAGKELNFVLTVEPNNTNYTKANAFWFLPQIANP
jgi:hypothetical protein